MAIWLFIEIPFNWIENNRPSVVKYLSFWSGHVMQEQVERVIHLTSLYRTWWEVTVLGIYLQLYTFFKNPGLPWVGKHPAVMSRVAACQWRYFDAPCRSGWDRCEEPLASSSWSCEEVVILIDWSTSYIVVYSKGSVVYFHIEHMNQKIYSVYIFIKTSDIFAYMWYINNAYRVIFEFFEMDMHLI